MGFSKCLYATSRCIVASGRQSVDFDTSAALAKAPIDVMQIAEADAITGTRIELHGVDLPDLAARIETLCLGFPVPVLFNGKALERRFAEAHLATMPSPMGTVHLTGTRDGKHSHHTMVFLQGLLRAEHGLPACLADSTSCTWIRASSWHACRTATS